jgi:hypothetical protein
MDELSVVQARRLKGRATVAVVAAVSGIGIAETEQLLQDAMSAEHVIVSGNVFRLTPLGRERLNQLIAEERDSTDLKSIVTAWQMKSADEPNDHADAGYDAEVVDR